MQQKSYGLSGSTAPCNLTQPFCVVLDPAAVPHYSHKPNHSAGTQPLPGMNSRLPVSDLQPVTVPSKIAIATKIISVFMGVS